MTVERAEAIKRLGNLRSRRATQCTALPPLYDREVQTHWLGIGRRCPRLAASYPHPRTCVI
jgi:hypothetical protein